MMGKSSKKYPGYSAGTLKLNGEDLVKTYKKGNNVISNYIMSEPEKSAYRYAQNSFNNSLSKLNVFDENTQKDFQNQLNAYTQKGQKMIDNIYNPMLNNLKTDIASRFGNLDNSVFMDNLNSIESNRADAVNSLAQDVLIKQDELINNELSRRYNYMNFLQDLQNQTKSSMLNFIGSSQANSASGNNYNAQAYAANSSSSGNLFSNLGSSLTTALMSSNPYSAGASAALGIVGKYM